MRFIVVSLMLHTCEASPNLDRERSKIFRYKSTPGGEKAADVRPLIYQMMRKKSSRSIIAGNDVPRRNAEILSVN